MYCPQHSHALPFGGSTKTMPRPFHTSSNDLSDDLGEVLSSGGGGSWQPSHGDTVHPPGVESPQQPRSRRATKTGRRSFGSGSHKFVYSGTVKGEVDTTSYGLDYDKVVRYTDIKEESCQPYPNP